MSEERLKAAFAKFDKDGSGEIDASELVSVLLELGKSEEDAKLMAGVGQSDRHNTDIVHNVIAYFRPF